MEFPDSILDFDSCQSNSSQMKQFIEASNDFFSFSLFAMNLMKPVKSHISPKPKGRNLKMYIIDLFKSVT